MHIEKRIKKSIIAFSVVTVLTVPGVFAANKVQEYNAELEKVKQQEKENAAKLSGVEKELAEYNYEIAELDGEMDKYSRQLAELQLKVEEVNKKLSENESALQNSAQVYNAAEDMYAIRLRSIYENGIPSFFDILFASKGVTDFFSRMNVYTSILDYDKSLVTNMKSQKEYIDYIKKDIEVQKLQLDQLKYDTQKSTDALNSTMTAKQNKVKELENSQSSLKANSELLAQKRQDALRKVEDEVARVIAESRQNSSGGTTFTGSDYAWPVPGYTIITTRFGEVYNLVNPAGSAHTGTDIAGSGIFGKPILAMQSGTISVATYSNYGYGNYVMINHGVNAEDGKTYITLYGHCSSLAVSKGQAVVKGQVIGYVGSTGNSTGPHLHLEVRINGKITDPLKYFPAMSFTYY